MHTGVYPRKVALEMSQDPSAHEEGQRIFDEIEKVLEERKSRDREAICGPIRIFREKLAAAAPEAELHAAKMAIPDKSVALSIHVSERFTNKRGGIGRSNMNENRAWKPGEK